ncbi:S-methyl-5'-thioadenosine phosphorylase [soil metagenome]
MSKAVAELGVIGGSGFYSFFGEDVEEVAASTPWGEPSAPVTLGEVGGRRVAFLPRHGRAHEFPAHRVNYRANLWALRQLGVQRVLAPCACGSLRPDVHPGDVAVCEQLVDRTSGRPDTYFDGPVANHVGFADPYCPELRRAAVGATAAAGLPVHDGGTVVVVQGPRFSTRAESRWFRSAGWDVVNMTQHPEAVLARELGLCHATLALVTDYDTGVEGVESDAVTQTEVFRFFEENLHRLRDVLASALPAVPPERTCACAAGSNGIEPLPPGSSPR